MVLHQIAIEGFVCLSDLKSIDDGSHNVSVYCQNNMIIKSPLISYWDTQNYIVMYVTVFQTRPCERLMPLSAGHHYLSMPSKTVMNESNKNDLSVTFLHIFFTLLCSVWLCLTFVLKREICVQQRILLTHPSDLTITENV